MHTDVRCPACDEPNPERARFCLGCGAALAGRDEARESRRVVTVVFTDMVGSTALGERLDQESLRSVMDAFYARMREAIEAEDGTLARFVGDAVLAVWGVPEVRENDALRAVRAAERIRQSLDALNEDLAERWDVRIGVRTSVNTGEVVVDAARPADLLVGDTLNAAAHLEQAASDGEVLVGEETYRLVRDAAIFEAIAPVELKGKAEPMAAWRLVDGLSADRRGGPRLESPLVGREVELARLHSALVAAETERACRLVTVIGSPGVGKTRLLAEFVAGLGDGAAVLRGRCEATGEGLTYLPVSEMLGAAGGVGDDDPPEAVIERLAAALPPQDPDRDRIATVAAALLGAATPAGTDETFWAIRRLLEATAAARPAVVLVDDVHWGQPTFLDLIEHLVEWIADAPVLVVLLARPELRELRPRLAERGLAADVIPLEPLAADAGRALVAGLLGTARLPQDLAGRVLDAAEGNPLFVGETLRMLVEDGVLRRQGDAWVADGPAEAVAVPPTINALLSARIERLEHDERTVVEHAAVIGHRFYPGAVTELVPARVRPAVGDALTTLSRKEMVRPEDEWWLDEHVHRFHHVLVRDAAYRALLKTARADLHERYAGWLEAKTGDVEELAGFHLEQAYGYRAELGPLDAAGRGLGDRAAQRLHVAGRRALERDDLPAAVNLLSRAVQPCAPQRRSDVQVDLCEAMLSGGDVNAAEPVIDELRGGRSPRIAAWAAVFAAQRDGLVGAGNAEDAARAATAAAAVLREAGDIAGEAKAHQVVAQQHALLGGVASAQKALDLALVAAREVRDERRIRMVLAAASRAALWGPAPVIRASGQCLDIVRIARTSPGNRAVEAAALCSQAVLEAMRERFDRARTVIALSRAAYEELGLTLELHETAIHAGLVELLAGESVAAEQELRAARDGLKALGVAATAAHASALLAHALVALDRGDEAIAATVFAEQHGGDDLKTTICWLGARAEALIRRGELDDAGALARRGVALAEPTDALADKADALMTLAATFAAAGEEHRAREAAARARELYSEKGHTAGAARAARLAGEAAADPQERRDIADVASSWDRPGIDPEVVRAIGVWVGAFNERDWATARATLADEIRGTDRRQLGSDVVNRTPDEVIAMFRAITEHAPGIRCESEVLAGEVLPGAQRVAAYIATYRNEGESPMELQVGIVSAARDGLAIISDNMDPDPEKILARYAELRSELLVQGGGSGFEDEAARSEAVAGHLAYVEAFNAHDWDAVRALCDPGWTTADHRHTAWEPLAIDTFLDQMAGGAAAVPDLHMRLDRVIACSRHVTAHVQTLCGTQAETGGAVEVAMGVVSPFIDGRALFCELFEPDDPALLARFEELVGEHDGGDVYDPQGSATA